MKAKNIQKFLRSAITIIIILSLLLQNNLTSVAASPIPNVVASPMTNADASPLAAPVTLFTDSFANLSKVSSNSGIAYSGTPFSSRYGVGWGVALNNINDTMNSATRLNGATYTGGTNLWTSYVTGQGGASASGSGVLVWSGNGSSGTHVSYLKTSTSHYAKWKLNGEITPTALTNANDRVNLTALIVASNGHSASVAFSFVDGKINTSGWDATAGGGWFPDAAIQSYTLNTNYALSMEYPGTTSTNVKMCVNGTACVYQAIPASINYISTIELYTQIYTGPPTSRAKGIFKNIVLNGASTGTVVSSSMKPAIGQDYSTFTANSNPGGGTLTFDILNGSTGAVIAANVASGYDLSGIPSTTPIKLRANLARTAPNVGTPVVNTWTVQTLPETTPPSNPIPSTMKAGINFWGPLYSPCRPGIICPPPPGPEYAVSGQPNNWSSPNFAWDESTDAGVGVAHYAVSLQKSSTPPDMTGEGAATTTSSIPKWFPPSPLTSGGTYYMFVRADDASENKSAWVKMFTYVLDIDPPASMGAISETKYGTVSGGPVSGHNDPLFSWTAVADPGLQSAVFYDVFWEKTASCSAPIASSAIPTKHQTTTSYAPIVASPGAYCLRVFPVDALGNFKVSATTGNRFGGASFAYSYDGPITPSAYIANITTTTNSPMQDAFAFPNDNPADGSWSIYYGLNFNGTINVTARTGEGEEDKPLTSAVSSLTFPAMLNVAAQVNGVPTTPINLQKNVQEFSQSYPFALDSTVSSPVEVKISNGATTLSSNKIYFKKFNYGPTIGVISLSSNGPSSEFSYVVGEKEYDGYVIGETSTQLTFTILVSDFSGSERIHISTVICPTAFNNPEKEATYVSQWDLGVDAHYYSCTYALTTPTSGIYDLPFTAYDNLGNSGTRQIVVNYDKSAPEIELDAADHPGLTYFVSWKATDDAGVASYAAKVVTGTDCSVAGTSITLSNDKNKLELANNGKRFCLQATDNYGSTSDWASVAPGAATSETLSYGLGGVSATERIVTGGTSLTTYTFGDNVGSATMTVDTAGATAANVRYLPFGEERWAEVDMPTDRGYTGQRNEQGMGLMDYNARYYSPLLGRFISPDTIVQDPADAKSFDRYAYVGNNPIMHNDPSGHCIGPVAIVCAIVVLALPALVTAGPQITAEVLPQMNMMSSWQPDPSNPVDMAFDTANKALVFVGVLSVDSGAVQQAIRGVPNLNLPITGGSSGLNFVGMPPSAPAEAGIISPGAKSWVEDVATNSRVLTPEQAQRLASAQTQAEFEQRLGAGWNSEPTWDKKGTSYKQGKDEVRLMDKGGGCFVFRWSTCVPQTEAVESGLKIHQLGTRDEQASGWVQQIPPPGNPTYGLNWTLDGDLAWVTSNEGHITTRIPIIRQK